MNYKILSVKRAATDSPLKGRMPAEDGYFVR